MAEGLTDKQHRFCEEYLANGYNATQAAISAGYSEDTARSIGAENLTKPDIKDYIETRKKEILARLKVNQDRILQEYARIAFNDIRGFYDQNGRLLPINELDDDAAAALAGVEVDELWGMSMDGKVQIGETKKIKRWDKLKALDSLGDHLGMFTKKVDVTTNGESLNREDIEKLTNDEKLQLLRLKQKMKDGS